MTTKTTAPRILTSKRRVTLGSHNVFADLGLPNPEQQLVKARLTPQIYRIIKRRGMTQSQAATALGIKQPHVSLLMRNRAGSFSIGRLLKFLTGTQRTKGTRCGQNEGSGGARGPFNFRTSRCN